jgi:branched-chain amino acid transport system permease protein
VSDRRRLIARVAVVALVAFLLWLPQYAEGFWLQTGLFAMSAAIGAIGLTLLVGVTGQLSLAHAFYIAVGAYGYCYLAGEAPPPGATSAPSGAGLPPVLAAFGAVLVAGLAGALFSPIAGRLRGIYLGLASLGLVFIGQHILFNAKGITGGFNGRDAAPMSIFGFSFSDHDPDNLVVFGVPYGQLERLWYLGLLLVAVSWWYARNLVRSRPGRAM